MFVYYCLSILHRSFLNLHLHLNFNRTRNQILFIDRETLLSLRLYDQNKNNNQICREFWRVPCYYCCCCDEKISFFLHQTNLNQNRFGSVIDIYHHLSPLLFLSGSEFLSHSLYCLLSRSLLSSPQWNSRAKRGEEFSSSFTREREKKFPNKNRSNQKKKKKKKEFFFHSLRVSVIGTLSSDI